MLEKKVTMITIEVTTHCNSHCPQCPRFDEHGYLSKNVRLQHLPLVVISNAIPREHFGHLKKIVIEGDRGDGIMHPDIEGIIRHFDFVDEVLFFTNGGVRDLGWWKGLADISNLKVIFSIDGLSDTNHLYRINVDFDRVMANASAFIGAGGHAIWKCILFKHNENQVDGVVNLSRDMGFTEVMFTESIRSRFGGMDEFPVFVDGMMTHGISPSRYTFVDAQRLSMVHTGDTATNPYGTERLGMRCPWLDGGRIYISYLGYVLPCCMMHQVPDNGSSYREELNRLVGDVGSLSIHNHRLDAILGNDFFSTNLERSLSSHATAMTVCKNLCGYRIQ